MHVVSLTPSTTTMVTNNSLKDAQQSSFLSSILQRHLSGNQSINIDIVCDNARRPSDSLLQKVAPVGKEEEKKEEDRIDRLYSTLTRIKEINIAVATDNDSSKRSVNNTSLPKQEKLKTIKTKKNTSGKLTSQPVQSVYQPCRTSDSDYSSLQKCLHKELQGKVQLQRKVHSNRLHSINQVASILDAAVEVATSSPSTSSFSPSGESRWYGKHKLDKGQDFLIQVKRPLGSPPPVRRRKSASSTPNPAASSRSKMLTAATSSSSSTTSRTSRSV